MRGKSAKDDPDEAGPEQPDRGSQSGPLPTGVDDANEQHSAADLLFEDSDEEPESSANITTARATLALGGSSRPSGAPPTPPVPQAAPSAPSSAESQTPLTSSVDGEKSAPSASGTSRSAPRLPMPTTSELELEAQPRLSSHPDAALPPVKAVSLPAVGTPAPMAVPSLRPPTAPPPPVRTTVPPPPPGAGLRSKIPPAPPAPKIDAPSAAPNVGEPSSGTEPSSVEEQSSPTLELPPPEEIFGDGSGHPRSQIPEAAPAPTIRGSGPVVGSFAQRAASKLAPGTGSKAPWIVLVLGLVIAAALGVSLLFQEKPPGVLAIAVSNPANEPMQDVRVFVDGVIRCTVSPCQVDGLSLGPHELHAEAADHVPSKPHELQLREGVDVNHSLILLPVPKHASLRVAAIGDGLRVFVDGRDLGPPPVDADHLEPGEHIVRVEGQRFEALNETISLSPDERRELGPLAPPVKLGQLTVNLGPGADDATVKLNDKPLSGFPVTVDLPGQQDHQLTAVKEGFDDFKRVIKFPNGKAKLEVDVALLQVDEETDEEDDDSEQEPPSRSASAAGTATLNINSIPSATVLLNGKRIGRTPLLGVKVKPGKHALTFVHPQKGRKSKQIVVKAGRTRTVAMRL